jgi:hypothetical protein
VRTHQRAATLSAMMMMLVTTTTTTANLKHKKGARLNLHLALCPRHTTQVKQAPAAIQGPQTTPPPVSHTCLFFHLRCKQLTAIVTDAATEAAQVKPCRTPSSPIAASNSSASQ